MRLLMGNLALVVFPSIADNEVAEDGRDVEAVRTIIELAFATGFEGDCESERCDMLGRADGRRPLGDAAM
jgi:hypothetical protein